jgi:hypothetical protein
MSAHRDRDPATVDSRLALADQMLSIESNAPLENLFIKLRDVLR